MITDKRVLFIANKGYRKAICEKLNELGFAVDYFNDKPNDGFICKTLGRFRVKIYEHLLTDYYLSICEKVKGEKYDYILMIRGEYVTERALDIYKQTFKGTKMILYMWDSIENNKGIERKWCYFDKVFSFDRLDCLKYKEQLCFLPLFYIDAYRATEEYKSLNKYDVSFIGTAHGDRPRIMDEIKSQCKNKGKICFIFLYSPHRLVFLWNKIRNKQYKGIKMSDVSFVGMSTEDVVKVYSDSRCIVDVESNTQTGLTMRTIEALGMKKKFATTNKDIVNYDFYNPNNILILDRNSIKFDFDFLETDYEELDTDLYEKYSLESWVKNVLGI